MSGKAQDRNTFETLTVGLLVAGLVLATLLMLGIAWRMRQHDLTSRELAVQLEDRHQLHQALVEQLGRYEARAQKLEAGIDAEQRRRAEQRELDRQAELQRAQDRQKALAEEEQKRRNAPAEQMRMADQAFREGRLADALQRYTQVIQADPSNARAWANRGKIQHSMRRISQALEDLDRAVAADPRDAYVLQTRAGVLLDVDRTKRAQEALADCDRALQLGGNEALLHYYRGCALQALDRLDEARVEFQAAHDATPPNQFKRMLAELLRQLESKKPPG